MNTLKYDKSKSVSKYNCFHGTTRTVANIVKDTSKFQYNLRNDHWLGNGIYFFIEDYDKAKWWAKTLARRERKSKASVISLAVTIQRNKILDLDAEKERKDFYQFVLDFIAANPVIEGLDFTYTSSPNDENIDIDEAKLRCFMLDLIQKINNYDACKFTFVDDKLTYSLPNVNSSIIRNNAVQLCIYNQSVIDFSTLQLFR